MGSEPTSKNNPGGLKGLNKKWCTISKNSENSAQCLVRLLSSVRMRSEVITLGAHAQRGYGSWICLSACVSVCLLLNISLLQCSFVSQTIRLT